MEVGLLDVVLVRKRVDGAIHELDDEEKKEMDEDKERKRRYGSNTPKAEIPFPHFKEVQRTQRVYNSEGAISSSHLFLYM